MSGRRRGSEKTEIDGEVWFLEEQQRTLLAWLIL
jgi:hypothetical protein